MPAECDVSIRPGWFYHAEEDGKVRSPENLLDLYFASVGRGAVFLLNLPPDRRGLIHENDVKSLRAFRRLMDATFRKNLAQGAKATEVIPAKRILDLGRSVTFNVVRLREDLRLGQRVEAFVLDQWKDGQWVEFAGGTSVGHCRLTQGTNITTEKVRR